MLTLLAPKSPKIIYDLITSCIAFSRVTHFFPHKDILAYFIFVDFHNKRNCFLKRVSEAARDPQQASPSQVQPTRAMRPGTRRPPLS